MKPTFKRSTRRNTVADKRDRRLQSQLAKGREFMKEHADRFRALAKEAYRPNCTVTRAPAAT